jgi:hypothetical protein
MEKWCSEIELFGRGRHRSAHEHGLVTEIDGGTQLKLKFTNASGGSSRLVVSRSLSHHAAMQKKRVLCRLLQRSPTNSPSNKVTQEVSNAK